jgi:hypothetical protein
MRLTIDVTGERMKKLNVRQENKAMMYRSVEM